MLNVRDTRAQRFYIPVLAKRDELLRSEQLGVTEAWQMKRIVKQNSAE